MKVSDNWYDLGTLISNVKAKCTCFIMMNTWHMIAYGVYMTRKVSDNGYDLGFKGQGQIYIYLKSVSGHNTNPLYFVMNGYMFLKLYACQFNKSITFDRFFMSGSKGGGGGRGSRPPSENHKNIGFLGNTGTDPLKIMSTLNVGPSSARQPNAI